MSLIQWPEFTIFKHYQTKRRFKQIARLIRILAEIKQARLWEFTVNFPGIKKVNGFTSERKRWV